MKLIVVNDNDNFRFSIQIFLEKRLGQEVIASFSEGYSFLKYIPELSLDVILMDISMSGIDGYQMGTTLI
jgi:DNA-binding NarL/FixJ family response regulator